MIFYTCSYIPLEILMGTGRDFERLLSVTPSSCQSWAAISVATARRSTELGWSLTRRFSPVADSCDAMRRVGDLLNESSREGVFICAPWKRDELAVEFMASESFD